MGSGIDFGEFDEGRGVNYWELDRALQRELERIYTDSEFEWAESRLSTFGRTVGHKIADNADYIDDNGPVLESYDKHGEIQNYVRYPAEQHEDEELAYEAGIVADSFHAPPGREGPMPFSHNLAMQYLLCYADPGFDCPVAMTTGAALVLEKFGDEDLEPYYRALTSRDYDDLVEGAMFLTEKQGGSDVGANETSATYDEESGYWRLEGEKWFCSNIDAEGTLALARTEGAPEGTAGLSLFLVPHADPDGGVTTKRERRDRGIEEGGDPLASGGNTRLPPEELNDQYYRRLKDKLGTISVPTGEVEFTGAKAILVGEEQNGFTQMAEMLNIERLSNAAASCGIMGRALLESRIYAANREAFGKTIDQYPLMKADLVDMTVDHEAATAFTFEAARLFSERERAERAKRADGTADGDGETDTAVPTEAGDAYRLMRLLIPIAKARTARMAVDTASYAMEVHGGNGYVNDFVTNRLLRDAQVLPIWEGTENILSLDVLRALEREEAHEPFLEVVQERLDGVDHSALEETAEIVESEYNDLATAMATLAGEDPDYAQLSAKRLAHYIFDVFTAALLLEQAQTALEDGNGRMALLAKRFVANELEEREARGIADGERLPLEHFDAIVRFESVEPERLSESVPADD
ncbi:acyl-CoA dehydrogenase family protein [Halostagnicola sp. A-GB9-2]|uniref:acyl-CoA dehydrogenase family protein n=1 Tax=Halostagnicola sp. A-GB9-2 TaxID=3048066 RepID=UPI0024BFB447|nr:acyl-CoA dehydrogenase family protein [Halostagnicola sp. A-GB9-2]MDJ1432685.1 acyl-CoA dehydrogenase family protein [Halostagnicola sp. A-GB9-2]